MGFVGWGVSLFRDSMDDGEVLVLDSAKTNYWAVGNPSMKARFGKFYFKLIWPSVWADGSLTFC